MAQDVNLLQIKEEYKMLRQKTDAAYLVLKHEPSSVNVTRHAALAQELSKYSVETMAAISAYEPPQLNKAAALENLETYGTCSTCEKPLLYDMENEELVVTQDFVPGFPGWCYQCLVTHCTTHDCEYCELVADADTCSFKEVKYIHENRT
jgi:hypothetical protein